MARELIHKGDKSWWDGSVKTLCGLKILSPQRIWFPSLSSGPRCLACDAVDKGGKR